MIDEVVWMAGSCTWALNGDTEQREAIAKYLAAPAGAHARALVNAELARGDN